jgi:hypothetical protein
MPLTITRRAISSAMSCNLQTVSRRLKGLPVSRLPSQGRGAGQHVYQLADVLTRVRKPQHIGPLFRASTDDSSLHVGSGPDVMERAERLYQWLTEPMRYRYSALRSAMTAGLASARGGAAYMPYLETLNRKVLLHSEILKHVVFGTRCEIAFTHFAPAFALTNAGFEPEATEMEAAA